MSLTDSSGCLLNVYALPSIVAPEELRGGTAVVIDVLRAATTIVYALEAGAKEVVPCMEVEQARQMAAQFDADQVVLGGERDGIRIDGFHLGNSPTDYTPDSVGGRTLVYTTTNGTRALDVCRQADRVLVASFLNASAVCRRLADQEHIHLICAGTRGQYSRDDVLLAGLLVERLDRQSGSRYRLNAQALTARENWTSSFALPYTLGAEPLAPETLAVQLRASAGGQHLVQIGLEDDILTAAHLDSSSIVPELDLKTFRIRAS